MRLGSLGTLSVSYRIHVKSFHERKSRYAYYTEENFGDTGEPFTIIIAGQSIYVLTSPNDIEALYKNKTILSWELFVQDHYRWIVLRPSSREALAVPNGTGQNPQSYPYSSAKRNGSRVSTPSATARREFGNTI